MATKSRKRPSARRDKLARAKKIETARARMQAARAVPPEQAVLNRKFTIHPAADLLPAPSEEDYARLRADIRQHGQRVPITVTLDGQILDGRTRKKICDELGIPCPSRVATTEETRDPTAYVLSLNSARRHLSPDQIAAIYLQGNAPKIEADQQAAKVAQRAGLKKGKSRGVGSDPTGKTAKRIAKATGVSQSTAKRALKIKKLAPAKLAEVAAGTVSAAEVLKEVAPTVVVRPTEPGERDERAQLARDLIEDGFKQMMAFGLNSTSLRPEPTEEEMATTLIEIRDVLLAHAARTWGPEKKR